MAASVDRTPQHDLRIVPVTSKRDLNRFIRQPWPLYKDDPAWVPPLMIERRQHLGRRNPYFAHGRWQAWIAYRNDRPVGRISAQIDDLYRQHHDSHTGFFGMLEAEDSNDTFAGLLQTAEAWLQGQGMHYIQGPFNLSINEECGLLVDGFTTPPVIMTGHARPYYGPSVEACGYQPIKDLLAYTVKPEDTQGATQRALGKHISESIHLRSLRRTQLDEDLAILRDIFNDAWSDNWGFIPFTEAEFNDIGQMLLHLVTEDFVQIAEVNGEPAAMIVSMPNINEAIQDLNGGLLPFRWAKLLWRLKVRYPKTARIPLMGIRKRYQRSLLGNRLTFLVIDASRRALTKRGIEQVEMSWILEDNLAMRKIIESISGEAYKRYRIYQKALR